MTLLESARALMFRSYLSRKFYYYSMLTTTWLLNRSPSRVLDWATPYELLFYEELDYTQAKTFGFLVYAMNLITQRHKFDYKNFRCVFLGFSSYQEEYLVFYMENNKLLTYKMFTLILMYFFTWKILPQLLLTWFFILLNPHYASKIGKETMSDEGQES